MARPKRASMREGPLADLFRSTTPAEESGEEGKGGRSAEDETSVFEPVEAAAPEPRPAPADPESLPYDREEEGEAAPPDPERVRAYRLEGPGTERAIPGPKDRLSRIFTDEPPDPEPPVYGRDEPRAYGAPSGPPRPHEPVIRVV